MLGMWHKIAYECGVAVSVWIVSTRPIAVMWITVPYGIVQNGSICMLLRTLPCVLLYQTCYGL